MHAGQRSSAAILVALSGTALLACSRGSARPAGPAPAKVKVATLGSKPIEESAMFIAELNSRRTVQLTPVVSGYLKAITAKAGNRVKAGTLLFHIDSAREEAQLKNLIAVRDARLAALALAEANYRRAQQLAPTGVVSEQELQQAATALASARADLAASEAQVRAQQVQVGYYRITAPFDGTLGDIPVKIGDFVTPTTVLTVFNQSGVLEPYVRVPLSLSPKLGDDSVIELLDESGKVLASGKVQFVSPTVDPATQTVLIKTMITNPQAFKTSQYVRARVVWGKRQALTVSHRRGVATKRPVFCLRGPAGSAEGRSFRTAANSSARRHHRQRLRGPGWPEGRREGGGFGDPKSCQRRARPAGIVSALEMVEH